jgi:predicted O-methyltransferase YrrM
LFPSPIFLAAGGACVSTILAGYLAYKTHKRFGKVDRNFGRMQASLKKLGAEVQNSAKLKRQIDASFARVRKGQATLKTRLARLDAQQERQEKLLSKGLDALQVAVADAQLEVGYLNSLNALPLRFPLYFGRWSIDGVTAKCIVDTIREARPKVVLELGSGSSTVLVAATLQALGENDARHIAVDHLEEFLRITEENLRVQGLTRTTEFWHCPLDAPARDGEPEWYSGLPEKLGDTKIDLLVVDGPPGSLHPEARRPAMEVLEPYLSKNAIIILDDASRPEEAKVLQLWNERFADIEVELTLRGKGCAVVRRRSAPSPLVT